VAMAAKVRGVMPEDELVWSLVVSNGEVVL